MLRSRMLTIDLAILHLTLLPYTDPGSELGRSQPMLRGTIALLCQELVMVYDVIPCDNSALYGCKYHRDTTPEKEKRISVTYKQVNKRISAVLLSTPRP